MSNYPACSLAWKAVPGEVRLPRNTEQVTDEEMSVTNSPSPSYRRIGVPAAVPHPPGSPLSAPTPRASSLTTSYTGSHTSSTPKCSYKTPTATLRPLHTPTRTFISPSPLSNDLHQPVPAPPLPYTPTLPHRQGTARLSTTEDVRTSCIMCARAPCLTLPQGADLDQVQVGSARFQHREIFEKAYRVGRLIGRGGFGSVYAGVRLRDQKMVAIKHIGRDKIRLWCSGHGKSVPKEVCLMRHAHGVPHVIKLLDFYERVDSFILILSRPSTYKDLFDYISERGSLPESQAVTFFRQVLGTVRKLKERNVVHRDIKDENILVNLKTNNLAIIDFGSGCHSDEDPLTEFEGTHLYAPPEWLQTGQYKGEDATVWSLGILLYVMLNGDVPYQSEKDICKGELLFRTSLSDTAKSLIKSCLTPNPSLRLNLAEVAEQTWVTQDCTPRSGNRHRRQP